MRRRLFRLLGMTLLIAGCASTASQRQENGRKLDQIFSECRTKFRESGGFAAEALCARQPIRRLYAERDYPYMDLVDLYLAHWLTIARQVDQGRLKVDEGQLQLTEQLFRVANEAERRDARYADYRVFLLDLRPSLLE